MTETLEPSLVPELLVADLDRSTEFWCNLCGFDVAYSRPEERFAYITLDAAHLMVEQTGVGRNWITGPSSRPRTVSTRAGGMVGIRTGWTQRLRMGCAEA